MTNLNETDRKYMAKLAVELANEMSLQPNLDQKFTRPEQRNLFKTIVNALQNSPSKTVDDIIAGFDDPDCAWYQDK